MRTVAQDDADYGEGAHLSLRVSVHLSDHTTVEVTTYPAEGRATIGLTGYRQSVGVTVFGRIPELRELRDLLTDTLAALIDTGDETADGNSPTRATGNADAETSDRAA